MTPCGSAPALDLGVVDGPLGNSVGAIGWPGGPVAASLQGPDRSGLRPPVRISLCPASAGCRHGTAAAFKIVTWLILPVVICLSQRLSHACLSISNLYGETANGSLNQLSFI